MGGGRTLTFDCTGNEVPVGYEELARGWSNESEKVKYCEGIILTLLVLLGITLHLNHTVNSPGGGGGYLLQTHLRRGAYLRGGPFLM